MQLNDNQIRRAEQLGWTHEEYIDRMIFQHSLVVDQVQARIDNGETATEIVAHVLDRVMAVYGDFNDGCGCCMDYNLKLALTDDIALTENLTKYLDT